MDTSGIGMDVDTSDDEAEYDVEAEEEDLELQKDFKGLSITSEYCPNRPRVEELQKFAHLFPELDDFQVQNGSKFADSVLSSREGVLWCLCCFCVA